MTTKEELLNELFDNTFIKLKPSPLGGVGVFAVRDIPQGCKSIFGEPDPQEKWHNISKKELATFPIHAQEMITNYCLFDEENYFVPAKGFKKMDLSHYINHSDNPNIRSLSDGDYFESLREIKAGEELLIDYGTIVDGDE